MHLRHSIAVRRAGVLQCVAVRCSVLQVSAKDVERLVMAMQRVGVLQCIAVCCSARRCGAEYCSVL